MHVHYYDEFYLCYTSNYQRLQKEEVFEKTWQFMGILLIKGIQLYPLIVCGLTGNYKDVTEIRIAASVSNTEDFTCSQLLTLFSDLPPTSIMIIIVF
jgi:hypothetical protein